MRAKRLLMTGLFAVSLVLAPYQSIAQADTSPPTGTPATVSADALPTAQVNGIVWATAVKGDTVYVAGKFTQARPAGVSVGGAGSVARANIMAVSLSTGAINTSFVHTLSGDSGGYACYGPNRGAQACALSVSPDGTKLFVGGAFTAVDGQPRNNFAAINLTNNTLLSGYTGTNNTVKAIASTNTKVFIGGAFSTAASQSRSRLAGYSTSNGTLDTSWVANVTGPVVNAMVIMPALGNLVVGGSFNKINNVTYYSTGAVKLTTGANVAWGSQSATYPIRAQNAAEPTLTGITSLSTDGTQIYLTSFATTASNDAPIFEGRAAVSGTNGALVWLNDCVGDSYAAMPIGKVLYSVSHAHSCLAIGGFPENTPRAHRHALAETTYKTGTNTVANGSPYPSRVGEPASTLLNWFPKFTVGNASGASQAGWTLTGNSNYLLIGGEFTAVNGVAQQGLVRFAVKANAPNKVAPQDYNYGLGISALPANSTGVSAVKVHVTGDQDNALLTYNVYRVGSTSLKASKTLDSRFWKPTFWTFNDTGLPPGTSASYYVIIKDPLGNSRRIDTAMAFDNTDSRSTYAGSGWVSIQNRPDDRADFGRSLHTTTTNGALANFTFYGSSVTVVGEGSSSRGTVAVTIDGLSAGTYTAYQPNTVFQKRLFTKSGLGFGKHKITLKKIDGAYMDVDAFVVAQDSTHDDNAPTGVTYANSANWRNRQDGDARNFGGGIHYTSVNGESVTFTVTGSSIAIMSEKNVNRGNMLVSIDGGTPVAVNTYAPSLIKGSIVYSRTGLTNGTHTVKITKSGGEFIDVDAVFSR